MRKKNEEEKHLLTVNDTYLKLVVTNKSCNGKQLNKEHECFYNCLHDCENKTLYKLHVNVLFIPVFHTHMNVEFLAAPLALVPHLAHFRVDTRVLATRKNNHPAIREYTEIHYIKLIPSFTRSWKILLF